MQVLNCKFTTIRAELEVTARELTQVKRSSRLVFGPGFEAAIPIEATHTLVNPQTLNDIQEAWGQEDATE